MIRVITNVALDSLQSVTVDVVDSPSGIPLAPEKIHHYPFNEIEAFGSAGRKAKVKCAVALIRFRERRERRER